MQRGMEMAFPQDGRTLYYTDNFQRWSKSIFGGTVVFESATTPLVTKIRYFERWFY
jgi:hypothetical protein